MVRAQTEGPWRRRHDGVSDQLQYPQERQAPPEAAHLPAVAAADQNRDKHDLRPHERRARGQPEITAEGMRHQGGRQHDDGNQGPPPPPMPPKKSNTKLFVGIGCGCLTLCGCTGVLWAVYANLPLIMEMLGQ